MPSSVHTIDINCDLGESYGNVIIGNDAEIFPYITSCNIACGFHGGDPVHVERTIKAALQYGVQIGAHPSYPDRENFGRKKMHLPAEELRAVIRYQLAALIGVTRALGGRVSYVKPHGALYNVAAESAAEALVVIESAQSMDENLAMMGLPGSAMEEAAKIKGIQFIAEAFADRRYQSNGRLVSRSIDGAVIEDPDDAAEQVLSIILKQRVSSIEGTLVPVIAQSICVHGDHPNTLTILIKLDKIFKEQHIQKISFMAIRDQGRK
ncbi:MAG TPA: 5-oxoprolinase subunit PxpA [Saprospiraceae bacterium]|nr:5-oxoprolinase subunit PxpA [Saprospiraceae bacterium]